MRFQIEETFTPEYRNGIKYWILDTEKAEGEQCICKTWSAVFADRVCRALNFADSAGAHEGTPGFYAQHVGYKAS